MEAKSLAEKNGRVRAERVWSKIFFSSVFLINVNRSICNIYTYTTQLIYLPT